MPPRRSADPYPGRASRRLTKTSSYLILKGGAVSLPILAAPVRRWHCPHCPATDVTREAAPHTRFHPCARLGGFSAPLIEVGVDATTVVHEREDYVGREDVQRTPAGRPVMSITTEYGDGRRDVAVYAPTAHGSTDD